MNKNIKLAVAGAILATASVANAGIVIPAGEWTLDVGGNVNAYTQWYKNNGSAVIVDSSPGYSVGAGHNTSNNFGNGLLPNFLSFSGSTRQNDLDVGFTISLQPGGATTTALGLGTGINTRQSFITFGDKSWGSVKAGKDIGIFASDAILSDMTLLGVGAAGLGGNTSLGGIGYGYIYADWKPQIAYTTPNFSGFQATVGITQNFAQHSVIDNTVTAVLPATTSGSNAAPSYEGKASYSFAANDVTGKIWVSGIASHVAGATTTGGWAAGGNAVQNNDTVAYGGDIGVNLNAAGFGLTGYYYNGSGIGHVGQGWDGYGVSAANGQISARDADGGYVQATYTLPTKTKLGISWGQSNLDRADGETAGLAAGTIGVVGNLIKTNEKWTVGAYHPLTKHLNLVAEFNHTDSENQAGRSNNANSGNLGAILFF